MLLEPVNHVFRLVEHVRDKLLPVLLVIQFQIFQFYINHHVLWNVPMDILVIQRARAAENVILNVVPAQIYTTVNNVLLDTLF
jgi:hypothetical protein